MDDRVAKGGGLSENVTEFREIHFEMHADYLAGQGAQDGLQEGEEEFADDRLVARPDASAPEDMLTSKLL